MTANQFFRRRKKLFRSQAKAAEALGVTQQAISMWETGARTVPLIVVKFMECLDAADKADRETGYENITGGDGDVRVDGRHGRSDGSV